MSIETFHWRPGPLELDLCLDPAGPAALVELRCAGVTFVKPENPSALVDLGVVGEGRSWSSRRYLDSVAGAGSRYVSHAVDRVGTTETLRVTSRHEATGLVTTTELAASTRTGYLRAATTVTHDGAEPVDLSWITSLVLTGALAPAVDQIELHWADNDWLAENRWQCSPLGTELVDISRGVHEHDPRGCFARTARGAWSTDGTLPLGILVDPADGRGLGWQIDHNGAWHWQVGRHGDQVYVSVLGPTDTEHQWSVRLAPGDSFTTVPVVLTASDRGWPGVLEELTTARRDGRRPHADHVELPVVFNDYMNTLMGDPTTAKLLPLVDAAAAAGAEIFCIDAGWYDDDTAGWWDAVGAWEPAIRRFPNGIEEVLDRIRDRGMRAGLWLEPEVVGVRSPLARTLPAGAFLSRRGVRVVEHGRYHLDLRHPAAVAHLDAVVDRLVDGLGVRYFKFDHNINPGPGTDHDADSPGAGLLDHNRAVLAWLDAILDRHPGLTIENCASGGMRTDYGQLSRLQLQSTSDQQDPYRYPPIAAAAPAAVTPEQAANWAYPQPGDSDDRIAFNLATAMLGRMYLSGHLDRLSVAQRELVAEGVRAHRSIRATFPLAQPFWPWGLPGWEDGWLAMGLRAGTEAFVTVWRRDDPEPGRRLDFGPGVVGARILYPTGSDAELRTTGDSVEVTLPRTFQAVCIAVTLED